MWKNLKPLKEAALKALQLKKAATFQQTIISHKRNWLKKTTLNANSNARFLKTYSTDTQKVAAGVTSTKSTSAEKQSMHGEKDEPAADAITPNILLRFFYQANELGAAARLTILQFFMKFLIARFQEPRRSSSAGSSGSSGSTQSKGSCGSGSSCPPNDTKAEVYPKSTPESHGWYPDPEFFSEYSGVVMFPTGDTCWKKPNLFGIKRPSEDRTFRTRFINFGPQHPAAHGVLRMILELDNEMILNVDPHIGLLHRGTEKLCEYKTYLQVLPYMDRLDYVSPMYYELGFCLATEKLLNVEVPRRAKYIRTLFCEIMRLTNHTMVLSGSILDTGAITPLFWLFEEREKLYEFCERVSGSRIHSCYFRPGGVALDIPIGLLDDLWDFCNRFGDRCDEVEDLITNNRIWKMRSCDIGVLTAHDALNRGVTGPILRACGVKWDLRKTQPYDAYPELDFDVIVGSKGDSYDRYLVRMREMRESIRIIKQCLDQMPAGEIKCDDRKFCPPARRHMKSGMEDLIHHFKYFSQGFSVPPGQTYTAVEAPKGEFGVYLVSDGSTRPYRVRLRAAAFIHLELMHTLCVHSFLADAVAILGSLDIVFGEVDR